jgi:hypothetical protein
MKITPVVFGLALAAIVSSASAADLAGAPVAAAPAPEPVNPVVAIVTLPFTIAGAIVTAILPPPAPAPVVAKY